MNTVNRIMTIAKHPTTIVGLGSLVADQATKLAIRATMPENSANWLVNNTLGLYHYPNENQSITKGFLLTLSATLIGTAAVFIKAKSQVTKLAAALITSGAIGNMIDRASFGRVTDFIMTKPWPYIYNLADVSITSGVLLFAYQYWLSTKDS